MRPAVAFVFGLLVAFAASAQDWPAKPVHFIVPYPPGGGTDVIARIVQSRLSEQPGSGDRHREPRRRGRRAGDRGGGEVRARRLHLPVHAFLAHHQSAALQAQLRRRARLQPGDADRQRAAADRRANPGSPLQSMRDVVAAAKAKPGSLPFASVGNGTPSHIAGELLKLMAGIDLIHVPYKGGGPAIADALGGQVPLAIVSMPAAIGARARRQAARARGHDAQAQSRRAGGPDGRRGAQACRTTRSIRGTRCSRRRRRRRRSSRRCSRHVASTHPAAGGQAEAARAGRRYRRLDSRGARPGGEDGAAKWAELIRKAKIRSSTQRSPRASVAPLMTCLGSAHLPHVFAHRHLDRLDVGDRQHGEHAVGDHHEEVALHELFQAQLPRRLVQRLVGKGVRHLAAVDEMHRQPMGGIHRHRFSLSRREAPRAILARRPGSRGSH